MIKAILKISVIVSNNYLFPPQQILSTYTFENKVYQVQTIIY
jgi:hypothetical protein